MRAMCPSGNVAMYAIALRFEFDARPSPKFLNSFLEDGRFDHSTLHESNPSQRDVLLSAFSVFVLSWPDLQKTPELSLTTSCTNRSNSWRDTTILAGVTPPQR